MRVKVAGIWKDSLPSVKVGGVWKQVSSASVRAAGGWKSFYNLIMNNNDYSFTTFDTSSLSDQNVLIISVQPDGKILVGGSFTQFNGTASRIVRLNSDGTMDTAFTTNTGTGANSHVNTIAVQSDGKILVGGSFTTFNGVTVNRIVRLNADGTRDTAFTTNTGTGVTLLNNAGQVKTIVVQPDGKILVGGDFSIFNNIHPTRSLVRLNADGTRDTAFTTNMGTGFQGGVETIVVQPDGKILVGGFFSTFNGVTASRIVRINADGTRDTAFTNNGTGITGTQWQGVFTIAIQPDGNILLGGNFETVNGVTTRSIFRINSDGTGDATFPTYSYSTGPTGNVNTIAVQSDGKILVGGTFPAFPSGVTVNRIVRLNADGTRDTAFTTNTGTGADNHVNTIAVQSDGKILLGGGFTTFNGVTVRRIVRLNTNGTRDTSAFVLSEAADNIVRTFAIQPDGKILVGGDFTTFNGVTASRIVRLNADGTRDTAFTTGTGAGNTVHTIAIQPDGKILLGGSFTTFNGATARRIVRLNSDGTRDTDFTTNTGNGANNIVNTIVVQPDGKILVGGTFTDLSGTAKYLARLNDNGTRDTAFMTNMGYGLNNIVNTIAVQSDGKILLGGGFNQLNGVAVSAGILRLNTDGTRDTAFTAGSGINANVNTIAVQSDGKILVGGSFTTFNGVTVKYIVRLNADGTRDTAFTTGTGANDSVNTIAVQSDGKILVGGIFITFNGVAANRIVRLNADGTRDTAFTTDIGTGPNNSPINTIAVQPDGKILVGGAFTSINNIMRSRIARLLP